MSIINIARLRCRYEPHVSTASHITGHILHEPGTDRCATNIQKSKTASSIPK